MSAGFLDTTKSSNVWMVFTLSPTNVNNNRHLILSQAVPTKFCDKISSRLFLKSSGGTFKKTMPTVGQSGPAHLLLG